MGLNTSHNAWDGPYSSFNEWRRWLAAQIGINLYEYIGYGRFKNGEYIDTGTKELSEIQHPIMPLLNHSDCDGKLTVQECRSIVIGLKKILSKLPVNNSPFSNYSLTYKFLKGCIMAANKNQQIEFH